MKNLKRKNNNARVTLVHSCEMRALHQKAGASITEIHKMFPMYNRRTVQRHAKRQIGDLTLRKKNAGGRPSKATNQDRRAIVRTVNILRRTEGANFTSGRIKVIAGVTHLSNRTVRRILNQGGYRYLQGRRKGLLTLADLKKRLKFCKTIRRRKLGLDFWRRGISFYLDAKGFQYKTNPQDQARAPRACQWRKRNEGLEFGLTRKCSKAGVVNVNFMVAISYGAGVVLCEPYFGSITAEKMATIVADHFDTAFLKSSNPITRRFLMDNCPRQKSKKAMTAYEKVKSMAFCIPPRSPDLNPIENFFNQVNQVLQKQALDSNITKESKEEFTERVKHTMISFDKAKIDRIIDTMPKRVIKVIQGRGRRTKY